MGWQTIIVAIIILAALAYTARRGFTRLNSFRANKTGAPCATGCGSCGGGERPATKPATVLVSIGRLNSPRHRTGQ
jgi:hypothetical protein